MINSTVATSNGTLGLREEKELPSHSLKVTRAVARLSEPYLKLPEEGARAVLLSAVLVCFAGLAAALQVLPTNLGRKVMPHLSPKCVPIVFPSWAVVPLTIKKIKLAWYVSAIADKQSLGARRNLFLEISM